MGKYHIPLTYKGNNPMTRTQWRRHQRKKKSEREAFTIKRDGPEANCNTVALKAQRKPYLKKFSEEDMLTTVKGHL